jgi:hypothetical protein
MVQIAAPHHNLRPIDLLQNIAPDFVDYARAVLKAKPQAERPSEKALYDLATAPEPVPETPAETLAARPLLERVAQLGDVIGQQTVAQVQQLANQAAAWLRSNPPGQPVAIEPRGCPTPGACSCVEPTPPAPDLGDAPRPTYLDAIRLAQGCHDYSGGHTGAERKAWHGAIDTVVGVLRRAAIGPWDSQTRAVFGVGAEAQAGEVAVSEPVSERLRIVRAGIRAGYNLGHHHTVEGGWGDPDEVADDIAQETLDDIGLPPAPQAGEVEA